MLTIVRFILELIGLGNWLDKFLVTRQKKQQAQDEANAPLTNKEEADYWDK